MLVGSGLQVAWFKERETAMPGFGDIVQKRFTWVLDWLLAGEKQVEELRTASQSPKSWQMKWLHGAR